MRGFVVRLLVLAGATSMMAVDTVSPNAINAPASIAPATRIRLRVLAPITSGESKTGAPFTFELVSPIVTDTVTIPVECTIGTGTIVLAGHAGSSGHEGDLTLRIDSLQVADGRRVIFADQRFEVNGRNQKVQSAALGFIPIIGFGARFIRGEESRIDPAIPVETVLLRAAAVEPPHKYGQSGTTCNYVTIPASPTPIPTTTASPKPGR